MPEGPNHLVYSYLGRQFIIGIRSDGKTTRKTTYAYQNIAFRRTLLRPFNVRPFCVLIIDTDTVVADSNNYVDDRCNGICSDRRHDYSDRHKHISCFLGLLSINGCNYQFCE
jgi:hypothetical protein